jgi:hypothetical protein
MLGGVLWVGEQTGNVPLDMLFGSYSNGGGLRLRSGIAF